MVRAMVDASLVSALRDHLNTIEIGLLRPETRRDSPGWDVINKIPNGVWFVVSTSGDPEGDEFATHAIYEKHESGYSMVVRSPWLGPGAELRAELCLISAAPELLAICKDIQARFASEGTYDYGLNAAIAKAECSERLP